MNEALTVFVAEAVRRARSRAFLLGLILGAIGVLGVVKLPSLIDVTSLASAKRIVITGDPTLTAAAKPLLRNDFTIVATTAPILAPSGADLQRLHADGIVELVRARGGLRVVAYVRDPGDIEARTLRRDLLPLRVQTATNLSRDRADAVVTTPVEVRTIAGRFESAAASDSARVLAFVMLFVLYLLIVISSQSIMSSVAEEKTSRIAELLVATVRPSALLAGKIAASLALALLQLAVWTSVGLVAGAVPSPTQTSGSSGAFAFGASDISPGVLALFVTFFVLAAVETSTLFAALGSLVNRTEDLGSVGGSLMMPLVFAFVLAMIGLSAPSSPLVVVTSFVPVLSPFVMVARIAVSSVPWWHVTAAIGLNLLAIWAIVAAAGKIFRVGMLLYGRAPSLRQMWTVLRT